ncbi:ARL14 effector protein, partial [Frankliniella fusca]
MCSIGLHDKAVQCSTKPYKGRKAFLDGDVELLRLRSGVQRVDTVCSNHEKNLLTLFENRQKYCCNPAGLHASDAKISGNLVVVDLAFRQKCKAYNLIPGTKVCKKCRAKVSKIEKSPPTKCSTGAFETQLYNPSAGVGVGRVRESASTASVDNKPCSSTSKSETAATKRRFSLLGTVDTRVSKRPNIES